MNGRYYLIATDLRIEKGEGWQAAQERGSRDIIIWESEDLVHWEKERSHTVGIREAGCVWAPEAVFDEEEQAFLVFFASKVKCDGEETANTVSMPLIQRILSHFRTHFYTWNVSGM